MSEAECLKERKASIKPLVEEYFMWIEECLADISRLPKEKTAESLRYNRLIIRLPNATSALSA